MNVRRGLAGLFASSALALAFVLWTDPQGGRPLLAQSARCGGYGGPLCTVTQSCLDFFGLAKVCTTIYTYYPPPATGGGTGGSGGTDGTKRPVAPDKQ